MNRMTRICSVTAGVVLGWILITSVQAAVDTGAGIGTPQARYDPTKNASGQHTPLLMGRISTIDQENETITVKGFLLNMKLKVGSKTEIAVGDKTVATLDDLRVGDRVQVLYHRDGSAFVADRISDTSWYGSSSE